MKTYLAALCFVVCLPIPKMDSVEIHFKQKVQYKNTIITWDSFIIEQAVEADGTPGPHAVNINLQFESVNKKASWSLTLPADYSAHFSDRPEQVTFSFEGFTYQIIDAELNSFDSGFLRLNVQ
jgi:hypothetical protein